MSGTHLQHRPHAAPDPMRWVTGALGVLKFASPGQAMRALAAFLATGCVGLLTDTSIYLFVNALLDQPALSRLVSLAVATMVTWQINRRITFAATGPRRAAQAMRYTTVALASQSVSYAVFLALIATVPALPHPIAILGGAAIAAVLGFIGQSTFGFRDRSVAPVTAKA